MWRQQPPVYELAGYRQLPNKPGAERAAALAGPTPRRPGSVSPSEQHHQHHQQQLRRKINSRERKRMQDLNVAMDALREVILPYSAAHCCHPTSSPPGAGRKLSKIATLLLARNYILLLGSSLQELRRILGDLSGGGGGPRWLLAAGLPLFATAPSPVLLSHQHHHHPDTLRAAGGKSLSVALLEEVPSLPCGPVFHPGTNLCCPCGVCKDPHLLVTSSLQAAQFPK